MLLDSRQQFGPMMKDYWSEMHGGELQNAASIGKSLGLVGFQVAAVPTVVLIMAGQRCVARCRTAK